MDRYMREILTILKEQYIKIVGEKTFQTEDGTRYFYLKHLEDNLYRPMDANAKEVYGKGAGNEIASGKMNALRSSSALTYNMFWDQIAEVRKEDSEFIGKGVYKVEFEKQYHTLKPSVSSRCANLDVFLYCKHTKEAVACEMKMTEWIFNKPGMLREAYLDPNHYIDSEVGKVFVSVAKELTGQHDIKKGAYSATMERYDVFQMFKHAVACYTACVLEESRKIDKLTLLNCVWTITDITRLSDKMRERYCKEEKMELEEFEQFKKKLEPIKALFAKEGIQFDIQFCTFASFLQQFEKTDEELRYLRRYTLD